MHFVKRTRILAPASVVFAFHERPDALERLTPPWQKTEIVQPPTSLAIGTRVILRTRIGPLRQTIIAEHVEYEPGKMFADVMRTGPFARWYHRHLVEPDGPDASFLTDDVDYRLPLGALGAVFGGWFAKGQIERLFDYRHRVTREHCEIAAASPVA